MGFSQDHMTVVNAALAMTMNAKSASLRDQRRRDLCASLLLGPCRVGSRIWKRRQVLGCGGGGSITGRIGALLAREYIVRTLVLLAQALMTS